MISYYVYVKKLHYKIHANFTNANECHLACLNYGLLHLQWTIIVFIWHISGNKFSWMIKIISVIVKLLFLFDFVIVRCLLDNGSTVPYGGFPIQKICMDILL